MAQDHYNVLGVARGATKDDIKRAYRKLAHKYHPDKKGGDEEKFKEVNEAYQVLGDDTKRSQYDQFGQTFNGSYGGGGPASGGNPFGGFTGNYEDLGNFSDIFETFFGGRGAGPQVRRGADVQVDVTISFQESALGVTRELKHRIYQTCERCHGNGAEPNTPIETCPTCKGKGTTVTSRQTMLGTFNQRTVCATCQGEGKQPKQLCVECGGEGRLVRERTLSVDIPAGINDGQQMQMAGKGEAPQRGGIAGDLYVHVHVTPDKTRTRDGNNVRSQATLSFTQAALGTEISIETLYGEKKLHIPAGTQPGTEIPLTGQGFPDLRTSRRGDHVVTVTVQVPTRLSRQQRKLLEDLEGSSPKKRGLFS